ncbi:GNAT family N-acetyltransferase [Candidatus Epulonipiscioides gigas]|nr:GNAT family N-acetyltransferase [Epulopiscium sp. SCG-C07WGA-EpuloA2]
MTIRKATKTDYQIIVDFNLALAKETEEKILDRDILTKGVKYLLENPENGVYYLAEIDGNVVGQLMYTFEWSDWRCGLFYWIQSVYVDKNYRKQGVFSALYRKVKQICDTSENSCGIRLYAEIENKVAHKTYLSIGMEQCHYNMFEYEKKVIS